MFEQRLPQTVIKVRVDRPLKIIQHVDLRVLLSWPMS